MTTLGKAVRLARLQNPKSGRILTVAVDHAPSYGILPGIEDLRLVVDQVAAASPDAMVMMKGAAERCFTPYAGRVALIIKCSMISPYHPELDILVSQVEDALRLGADAVAMALTVGSADQAQLLANYIHNFEVKLYIIPHAPDLEEIQKHAPEEMTCLFCKRNMLRIARQIAIQEDADAIVTGEIIGEHASQTIWNLRVIENAVTDFPIHRPLVGEDKVDIEHLAREIGTYEYAKEGASCCTLNPKYPSVKADSDRVVECEEPMDLSILSEELKNARVMVLREGK